jgi:DNA polymerase III subunit beta
MKAVALKENLHRPLTLLSRYISSRPALPVLANILIEATSEGLILSSTNLDVTVKSKIPAQVTEPGKITVPARLLAELVTTLPSGNVDFSTTETQLMLSSHETKAALNTISAADFPILPNYQQDNAIGIPLNLLQEVSQKVLFAAATDETRPVLTTLMLHPQADSIAFVSTDGFRLSEALKPAGQIKTEINKPLLLPANNTFCETS